MLKWILIYGFGVGSTSSTQSPTHQYTKEGTYVATCQVRDTTGQTASNSVTITVQANPLDPRKWWGGQIGIPHEVKVYAARAASLVSILVFR
jgi:PKD repeat protein